MIDVNEIPRKGVTFELDGALFKVLDHSHNKTGRGDASIRVKARNLLTGANIEKTFQSGDRVQDARLHFQNVQISIRTPIPNGFHGQRDVRTARHQSRCSR